MTLWKQSEYHENKTPMQEKAPLSPQTAVNGPRFVVGVIAHPDRAEMAHELAAGVGADVISWDGGRHSGDHQAGCAATHLDALGTLETFIDVGAEWAVVLEDDAVPVPEFRFHVKHALEHAPAPVVGLYLGRANPTSETQQQIRISVATAQDHDRAWIVGDCLIGSVGYAIRTPLIHSLVEFIADRGEELPLRISRWAQHRRINIAYTQPSLVDHADVESIGRPWRGPYYTGRRAWSYGTRECWDTDIILLGFCPVWSGPIGEP